MPENLSSMIKTKFKFKKGTKILASVEEIINTKNIIVSVDGQLFRVSNQSQKKFNKHDQIYLLVFKEHPLELRLIQPHTKNQIFERLA